MTPTHNWTEFDCIKLIREFRKNRILWDPKDPLYAKKSLKALLWTEIAQRIGMPADECKHKMVILMSSFRREKSKLLQSIKDEDQDISNCYKSTWFAFQEMAFLLDKETERKRHAEGFDNENDEHSLKKRMLERHVQPPIYSEIHSRKRSVKVRHKKEISKMKAKVGTESKIKSNKNVPGPSAAAHITSEIPRIAPGSEVTKQTIDNSPGPSVPATNEADEEIKSFATFIANKMKKYTETTKNAVQQAICDIIFKADQGHFEDRTGRIVAVESETNSLDQNPEFELDESSIKIEDIIETYSDSD